MKTLIINGSPRKRGETAALIEILIQRLPDTVRVLNAFEVQVKPCVDCRYCRTHSECTIKDEMQDIYAMIEESDCIVIASPIWFASLPAPLLSMASRLQRCFSARFFRKEPMFGGKRGAVILTAGGTGGEESAFKTASILLREMGVERIAPLAASLHTDRCSAAEDQAAMKAVEKAVDFLIES